MSPVWGVSMMRNEEDIALPVLQHMISEGVNGLVIANNLSTDRTGAILQEFKLSIESWKSIPIHLIEDPIEGYYQSEKMTGLAKIAAENGAKWIIPFDADELWCGRSRPLAEILRETTLDVVGLEEWTHVKTDQDPTEPTRNIFQRMPWRRSAPSSYPKIAFRWHPHWRIHQGNDGILIQDKLADFPLLREGVIHHFPARGYARFERKIRQGARAMQLAPELPLSWSAHWREWGAVFDAEGPEGLHRIYRQYFRYASTDGLIFDPAPWARFWRA